MQLIVDNPQHFKFKENLLWLGLSSLITAFIWISYSIYDVYISSNIDPEVEQLLEPLSPHLDDEVLGKLSSRVRPDEEFTVIIVNEDELEASPSAAQS